MVAVAVALTLDLAINISFNPTRSIIADVTPEGNPRTKGYTWMQSISGFFGVAAYVIGAIFGNYALIYVGVFLVFAFSVLPVFVITEKRHHADDEHAGTSGGTAKGRIKTEWGQLLKIYLAHGFSWVGVQTMFVYIIAFIQQKLILPTASGAEIAVQSGQIIAISFAVLNTVGFLLPAPILEPIAEKIGRVRTHMGCVAIMAAGYFGIVLVGTTPLALYALMAVVGIGWAAVVSLPFAIMTEKVDKSRTGLFMGIFNLSVVLPQLVVSLFLGSVIQSVNDKSLIFLISGVSLAISAILWPMVKDIKR
jgi:Na+/melibiose symporter-like transporter